MVIANRRYAKCCGTCAHLGEYSQRCTCKGHKGWTKVEDEMVCDDWIKHISYFEGEFNVCKNKEMV